MGQLFSDEPMPTQQSRPRDDQPLAERLRPRTWDDYEIDVSLDPSLITQLQSGQGTPPSLVLWGPPGTGKTSFAKLIGRSYQLPFVEFSAVLGGVQDIRTIVAAARKQKQATLLFVDEIHRFNKAQQDAFLPHVESGTIVLVGATTENPSFALNSALLSRLRVIVFPALKEDSLYRLIQRAEAALGLKLSVEARKHFIQLAGGDARRLINWCEAFHQSRSVVEKNKEATGEAVSQYLKNAQSLFYDRSGDQHYDTISAFIKSLRGSDADAALHYGFRMIEAGEDPRFILRRMMIFASEDIGNADPQALTLAVATADAFDRLGLPEGKIPLAHCITYLACAPKSNRSYLAMNAAIASVRQHPHITIPLHLRNASTGMMKDLGYSQGYQYPHDHEMGYVAGVRYLPEELGNVTFYEPGEHGYEKDLAERIRSQRQAGC